MNILGRALPKQILPHEHTHEHTHTHTHTHPHTHTHTHTHTHPHTHTHTQIDTCKDKLTHISHACKEAMSAVKDCRSKKCCSFAKKPTVHAEESKGIQTTGDHI